MKMQKFRIQHATATPKPQLKRHMRDAITRAMKDAKATRSFARFMHLACDAAELGRDQAIAGDARPPGRRDFVHLDQQARPAAQQ
ncbi:hypothetical protein [Burkholderia sp. BCC1630]|uniref:hypothetical protein n=1 Tax=Burkholderia sp. BCC1630 TaxID=2676304 RepID=UPI001588AF07|nr:hypothetical protein [Burkholderia sp. BCC1630]